MQIDLSRFRDAFFEEATEHLTAMEAGLLRLEAAPADTEPLHEIFRGAHSIKGAAATLGLGDIAELTHALETLLDRLRAGELPVTPGGIDLLLCARDAVAGLVTASREGVPPPADTATVRAALERASSAPASGPVPVQPPLERDDPSANTITYAIDIAPHGDLFHRGLDPLLLLRELAGLGELTEVAARTDALPPLAELDPERCYLAWSCRLRTDQPRAAIEEVFVFVRDCCAVRIEEQSDQQRAMSPAPAAPAEGRPAATEKETVRVDRTRLDKLSNAIGELVIAQSMMREEVEGYARQTGVPSQALPELNKIARDLQELSLSLRMVPISGVFQKVARIARDLSKRMARPAALRVEGEDTELDKGVVDRLGDPLLHMIRNAIDHGIEPPEGRRAAGKPAEGQLTLRAYHRGGTVTIELSDDGRGLDRGAIVARAVERGLVPPGQALSDSEAFALIFEPGFSTARTVTDISGRGVGLDVVRRNVEALQGSVHIRSQPGRGTTFTLRLPLTLAILDGLSVGLLDEVYILPLLSVIESFQARPGDIHRPATAGEVVVVRGEAVPVLRLHELLGRPARVTDPRGGLLVLVEDQGRKYALLVDELLGQAQVVMKSLDVNYQRVEGLAGATVLGDGRVALVLDIHGLTRLAGRAAAAAADASLPLFPR